MLLYKESDIDDRIINEEEKQYESDCKTDSSDEHIVSISEIDTKCVKKTADFVLKYISNDKKVKCKQIIVSEKSNKIHLEIIKDLVKLDTILIKVDKSGDKTFKKRKNKPWIVFKGFVNGDEEEIRLRFEFDKDKRKF